MFLLLPLLSFNAEREKMRFKCTLSLPSLDKHQTAVFTQNRTPYISLTEFCDFSFLSLFFKRGKIFCFPSLKTIMKYFQCEIHSGLLSSLFLCSRNTHILRPMGES